MGADGWLDITSKSNIKEYFLQVIEDAIYKLILKEKYLNESEFDIWDSDLSENQFKISFLKETEIEDEEIVIKRITLETKDYWDIYQHLIVVAFNSLTEYEITSQAWENVCECDKCDVEEYIKKLDQNSDVLYTYRDNINLWYGDTMIDFFKHTIKEPVEEIYDDILDTDSNSWKKTFLKLFPTCKDFIECLEEYSDDIKIEKWQMWT